MDILEKYDENYKLASVYSNNFLLWLSQFLNIYALYLSWYQSLNDLRGDMNITEEEFLRLAEKNAGILYDDFVKSGVKLVTPEGSKTSGIPLDALAKELLKRDPKLRFNDDVKLDRLDLNNDGVVTRKEFIDGMLKPLQTPTTVAALASSRKF